MAEKFNLLPKKESRKSSNTDKLLKRIAITTFAISLMIMIGLFSTLFFFSNRLKTIDSEINKNKTMLASLEIVESGLVIAKDRAQKISSILELRQNEHIYNKYLKVMDSLPQTIELKEINLTDSKTVIAFGGSNSKDFSDFIDWLMIHGDDFSTLYANSIVVDRDRGYVITMEAK